jgi:hypothetical protein
MTQSNLEPALISGVVSSGEAQKNLLLLSWHSKPRGDI